MTDIDLGGAWTLTQRGQSEVIPAQVPGCVHTDLLRAARIPDPFYRDNETELMWIGENDWSYARSFPLSEKETERDGLLLVCEGLDTFADVLVNGRKVGSADNQFRIWEFDIAEAARAGENQVRIDFRSTFPYIDREQRRRRLFHSGIGHHRIEGSNRVRKSQCNYGWDWGPMCVTHGIWRPIRIVSFDAARIADVRVRQDHSRRGKVVLGVDVATQRLSGGPLTAVVEARLEGVRVVSEAADIRDGQATVDLEIRRPHLWWPNGLGEQPLYEIHVELWDSRDHRLDARRYRLGLRTLGLDQSEDRWGRSFRFVVNGVPFFAKGANWIPADTFVTRAGPGEHRDLLDSAAEAHMNMLRVWGGGIYEDDSFYDACDELGICVWQDFMFACSAYPAHDEAWMENVRFEAMDTIRRLRHHPSLALWCGNNEIEQMHEVAIAEKEEPGKMTWGEYSALFDEMLPGLVSELDPQRSYWPSSSHSPVGDRRDYNNPTCGDAHLWSVWHGREPFEWYRTCEHRFNSEFGFQSFPEPRVVDTYTLPEDRNITSFIMEHHQRSPIGNDAILQYMLSWYKFPNSFDNVLWLSQILQGMAIKYAVEHWRRSMPQGMGTLYWQINDCWPVASWSSIDYEHNWKALHYMARDFFAPLLVSGVEDPETGKVEVHLTNDRRGRARGEVRWRLTTCAGDDLAEDSFEAAVGPGATRRARVLDFSPYLASHGERDLILWLEFLSAGATASRNLVTFGRPKHLRLESPKVRTSIGGSREDGYRVKVRAAKPALWVWCDLEGITARYSDRFFHLRAGESREVLVRPSEPVSAEDMKKRLRTYSLWDTFV